MTYDQWKTSDPDPRHDNEETRNMIYELAELQREYDDLLQRLNSDDISIEEAARIQAIEDQIAGQYGYEWAQKYLRQ